MPKAAGLAFGQAATTTAGTSNSLSRTARPDSSYEQRLHAQRLPPALAEAVAQEAALCHLDLGMPPVSIGGESMQPVAELIFQAQAAQFLEWLEHHYGSTRAASTADATASLASPKELAPTGKVLTAQQLLQERLSFSHVFSLLVLGTDAQRFSFQCDLCSDLACNMSI